MTKGDPTWLASDLSELADADLLRHRVVVSRPSPGRITVNGREYLDFASNDYLGLAADPRVATAVREFLKEEGWGAGASPLITGYHPAHQRLERELADFEGVEQTLLFGSGFVANFGVLSAIAGPGDVIFSEERNHASLIDGCRLSKATLHRYRGDRLEQLEMLLQSETSYRRRILVTDSVFSMDGDVAPLPELCDLADRYDLLIYLDEAHATGILGESGRGVAEHFGVEDRIPLRMGTLSKALGSAGAFVAASSQWCEWLLHKARPYVYSTALPPACAVAAFAALQILRSEPQRRLHLTSLAEEFRLRLASAGLDTSPSTTPIVPVLIGESAATLRIANELRAEGYWTGAIRPPTVAIGTSRLRVSFSAPHEWAEVERLASHLCKTFCGKPLSLQMEK